MLEERRNNEGQKQPDSTQPSIGIERYAYGIFLKPIGDELDGRAERYQKGISRTARVISEIKGAIHKAGLDSEVTHIGEPTSIGMIAIQCSKKVKPVVEQHPEVECMFLDVQDIEFPE